MDESDLIRECQAGRTAAFGTLVERYQREAIGHALAIVRCREDALDAVQESFLAAFKAIGRFAPGRPFYPWFYAILRHQCYDIVSRRRQAQPERLGRQAILALPADPSAAGQTELLERALAKLAPEDRELITLKHLDGLRYEDLAERLGIPAGTVMSRLYHARLRLRDRIVQLREREEESHA
jgi:RNA polymerase sigma-70 factor (ECF subfamily)